jgi:hypothetical protein
VLHAAFGRGAALRSLYPKAGRAAVGKGAPGQHTGDFLPCLCCSEERVVATPSPSRRRRRSKESSRLRQEKSLPSLASWPGYACRRRWRAVKGFESLKRYDVAGWSDGRQVAARCYQLLPLVLPVHALFTGKSSVCIKNFMVSLLILFL